MKIVTRFAFACAAVALAATPPASADTLNDLAGLRSLCPALTAIAHNGGESFKHARHTRPLGLPVFRLPSTSPANASWSFERKLGAWRDLFAQLELI